MTIRNLRSRGCSALVGIVCILLPWRAADAVQRTWIGGNVDWVDGAGNNANWSGSDEPDSDDEAVFNTANTVNLGSNNSVNGLTLSGGIDLFTNDLSLTVDGLVQAAGAGTNLFIGGAASGVNADDVTLNADGTIELRGGTLTLDQEVGASLVDINVGGNLIGNGTISFVDTPGVLTTVLINDGELTALSRGLTILSPPPVGTLHINNAIGTFVRADLDGAGETGVVNVNRNQTLDLNVAFADAFNGTMNLFQESHFNSLNAWTLAGGSIIANNGFVDNAIPTPDVPAGTSYIEGGLLTQSGGNINVVDTDGTLQIDAAFTMNGGTLTNSGTVIFNSPVNITTAAGYTPASINSHMIINAPVLMIDAGGNFNWDGLGAALTTINGTASLSLNVNQIDTTDNVYGGTLTLNDNADVGVSIPGTSWTMAGTLNKNGIGTSTVTGDGVVITGEVNANGGTLDMATTTTTGTAAITVNGTMVMGAASVFGGGSITGSGTLQMLGTSSVTANTTINVATFDWDGTGSGTTHTINSGVTFTINSTTIAEGAMFDPISLAGSGSTLTVNGPTEWSSISTVNANNAGVGTAVIGGTSRFVLAGVNSLLNVNGNTNITAPMTFGANSETSIDAGFVLDATNVVTYVSGSISGDGTYEPGTTNTVTGAFTINADNFNMDGGSWTVEQNGDFTVNTLDYEPAAVTNSFENSITLNRGIIRVNVADPAFVMNGTLNMNASGGEGAEWFGDPLTIGNDGGALDANLNVTGDGNANSQGRFFAPVTFNSDADVDVPAGASLSLNNSVRFTTVNAANNAEFTGAGRMIFNSQIDVDEAVTINMVGGLVDLDGSDAIGDNVNINAPLTVNAATFSQFGRFNSAGGVNTMFINNNIGTGVLTVNLDDPTAEWTLGAEGVINFSNNAGGGVLLAGSDANLNGTVNISGSMEISARVDIGGTINLGSSTLTLLGGTFLDPNTIAGGTINGVGILGTLNSTGSRMLQGFGTINVDVDFDGAAILFADDGTLTINRPILDAGTIGTGDADGTLNVTVPWNTGVANFVNINGGVFQGGTITVDNANGVTGHGLISSRAINNTEVLANSGTLVLQTAGNDNDWDGTTNTGKLTAGIGATLELRDVGAAHGFTGSVFAINGSVFANGFALDFNPGSSITLTNGGRYESTSSTDIGGTVTVNGSATGTIKVANNFFLTFEGGSASTLNNNLRLENNNVIIEAGATFSGNGALIIPDGSHVVGEDGANINVLFDNEGAFRPGNSEGIGTVAINNYQQTNSGELYVELVGTLLNQYDRLAVTGIAQLDGFLSLDIDGLFVPALGNTFAIISAPGGVIGSFDTVDVAGMPAGLAFHVDYLPTLVRLTVVPKPFFSADFDDDGDVDSTDYSIWRAAYNLNQLGDADGDNDSDAADYVMWRDQFGSVPGAGAGFEGAAVPEPAALGLVVAAILCSSQHRKSRAKPLRLV